MRIAVAGATGNIGSLTVDALARGGHEAVGLSRSLGVDLITGTGLDTALTGVEAIVDATNYPAGSAEKAVALFGTATGNLLTAGQAAGVRHHVLLSIAALGRIEGNAHYAGKREQERLVARVAFNQRRREHGVERGQMVREPPRQLDQRGFRDGAA